MANSIYINLAEDKLIAARAACNSAIEAALAEIEANAAPGMAGGKLSKANRDCWGTLAANAFALANAAARLAEIIKVNMPAGEAVTYTPDVAR